MAEIRNEKYVDADRLAEEFLIVNCIWDPASKLWQDGDTVHLALERYRRDVNPARTFLLGNYVADFDYGGMPTQEVYACYVTWCQNNGYRPLNSNNFGKEVKRALPGVRKGQKREGLQRMNVYYGLAVQEGSEVAVESVEGCQQWQ